MFHDFSLILRANVDIPVLIISEQYSAKTRALKRNPPVPNLPDLRTTSDIAYGAWSMTPGATYPRHIITWAVQNGLTLRAMRRAIDELKVNMHSFDDWPGYRVPMESDQWKAILGSPCGAAVGFFLATHKYPFGQLQVKSIRLFEVESYAFVETIPPCIYWEIGPSAPPPPAPPA
jgi:hypothetical protein